MFSTVQKGHAYLWAGRLSRMRSTNGMGKHTCANTRKLKPLLLIYKYQLP